MTITPVRPLDPSTFDLYEKITLKEAAAISGLSYSHIRDLIKPRDARKGKPARPARLQSGVNIYGNAYTTRHWLKRYLDSRDTRSGIRKDVKAGDV